MESALAKSLRWYRDQHFYKPQGQPWFQNPWHDSFVYPEREQTYSGPMKNKWRSDPRFQAIYKRETGRDLPAQDEEDGWSWPREHKWGAPATGDAPTAAQAELDQGASVRYNDGGGGPPVGPQSEGAARSPGRGHHMQDATDVPSSPTPAPRQPPSPRCHASWQLSPWLAASGGATPEPRPDLAKRHP